MAIHTLMEFYKNNMQLQRIGLLLLSCVIIIAVLLNLNTRNNIKDDAGRIVYMLTQAKRDYKQIYKKFPESYFSLFQYILKNQAKYNESIFNDYDFVLPSLNNNLLMVHSKKHNAYCLFFSENSELTLNAVKAECFQAGTEVLKLY